MTLMELGQRKRLIRAALGETKSDVVFTGGQLVNVYSGEILPDLWVAFKGDRVSYVGRAYPELVGSATEVFELKGRFLLPGFIDGHTHLDSIFLVREYARYAVAYGNTAAVSEVAMIANAFGIDGVEFFLSESANIPLRVFVLAPPLVPPFPELETSREFPHEYFKELLSSGRCLGIGETYWPRIIDLEERALEQYHMSEVLRKTREGHAAGARKHRLVAYAASGTSSDHEAVDYFEALERLRLGMAVMIREGYIRREMEAVSGLSKLPLDLQNVMIVTDLADPEEMATRGGMNLLLKKAVSLGFDPVKAVQMVTINVARYFGLRDLGGIAPGKMADAVVVDDLKEFRCLQVWAGGKLAAEDGKLSVGIDAYDDYAGVIHSVKVEKQSPEIFRMKADTHEAAVRVVEIVSETITGEEILEIRSQDGEWVSDPKKDIVKVALLNKSLPRPEPSLSFVKGLGIRCGAAATSLIWDTNNIMVLGISDEEMACALNRLIILGGGVVIVRGHEVVAELAFPVCGIISHLSLPVLAGEMGRIEDAFKRLGSGLHRPLLTLQTLPFTGLPYLRPTDKGLADIRKGKLVPLFVK